MSQTVSLVLRAIDVLRNKRRRRLDLTSIYDFVSKTEPEADKALAKDAIEDLLEKDVLINKKAAGKDSFFVKSELKEFNEQTFELRSGDRFVVECINWGNDFFLDMSRCMNCFTSDTEKIKKLFKEKAEEGRESLLILILTVVLNIPKMASCYCTCRYNYLRLVCLCQKHFTNSQYMLYQHSLDFYPLHPIVSDLTSCMCTLSCSDHHFVCLVLNTKYYYTMEICFSGKKAIFSISEVLRKWEDSYYKNRVGSMLTVEGFFKIFS